MKTKEEVKEHIVHLQGILLSNHTSDPTPIANVGDLVQVEIDTLRWVIKDE